MIDHLQNAALQADWIQREEAENHKAHVADAAVGDEFFQIDLHQRYERAVNDADHRQPQNPGHAHGRGVGQHRQAESQNAVCA